MYVCVYMYAWWLQNSEESILSLELEIGKIIRHHLGARNLTWALCKSNK